jgi:acylphosphatase
MDKKMMNNEELKGRTEKDMFPETQDDSAAELQSPEGTGQPMAQGMPLPSMKPESVSANMFQQAKDTSGGSESQPSRVAGERAGKGMPIPGMDSAHESESAPAAEQETLAEHPEDETSVLQRFPASEGMRAAPESAIVGIVEVEFRKEVLPTLTLPDTLEGERTPTVSSQENENLDEFNRIIQSHHLNRAEPSFDISDEMLHAPEENVDEAGNPLPDLRNFVTLYFPGEEDTKKIAEELNKLPQVERAVAISGFLPPQVSDPLVGNSDQVVLDPHTNIENQWYIHRTKANKAWNMASGAGVVIADIDWGYRLSHIDLNAHIDFSRAYNSFDGGTNVSWGDVSHGTAVMGIAGGVANNAGMAGVAYNSVLWPIQGNSGPGQSLGGSSWARAIDWVTSTSSNNRRKVIILEVQTNSFGNIEMVPSVNAAIRHAIAQGVVVCVAAGNGNRDASLDDANNPIPETGSILVGATAYHATENRRAGFSNFGPRITVSAPGDAGHDLTCASTGDTAYRNGFGGTSGATPKVAGTVALMLEANPALTHAQIREILNRTGMPVVTAAATPVGTFLNAEAAVMAAGGAVSEDLNLFVRGGDQALWHRGQLMPLGAWSNWKSLGGTVQNIAAGKNKDGRLEVFAIGSDHALWHRWQLSPRGPWSNWASMGGWIDTLAVTQNQDGRLEVFARGGDKALWHIWQTSPSNGWSGWASMGGWVDMVRVGRNKDGRLEVFARGSDKAVWHQWQASPSSGPWSGWHSLGGWVDMLEVGNNQDGRLEIFARGSNGAVWHIWQTRPSSGPWSGWASLGGWVDMLRVGRNKDGRLEIFARGSDKAVWNIWQTSPNSGWSGWNSLGGWIDLLQVGHNRDGRLEVFARGSDGAVWHRWQMSPSSGPWSGWASLGGWIDILTVI